MTASGMPPCRHRLAPPRPVLGHELRGAPDGALHAGGADEHVVRLLAEHELAGPRQRVEAALLERAELVLAVPVGEVGEHEERQPVGGLLVERAQDARAVQVAGVPPQQLLGLLPAVAAEVGVQQVHHGPQVAAFLDVDLEQVAQVVQARRGRAQVALLLHRGGLGVALDDEQPAQVGPVLAGHLLPGGLAAVLAERDLAAGAALGQEDAPAVVLHRHPGPSWPSRPGRSRSRCAGRRPWSAATGRASDHQSRNLGCQDSRARCSRRSVARPTLLGMRSL